MLVLQMDVRGGDEDVDAGPLGALDGTDGTVNVLLAGPRERQHDGPGHGLGDPPDGLEVALRRRREAGLDDVDAEVLELARDRQLLLHVHGRTRRLLAVAERRVEDLYPVHHRLLSSDGPPVPWPRNKKATSGRSARGTLPRLGLLSLRSGEGRGRAAKQQAQGQSEQE